MNQKNIVKDIQSKLFDLQDIKYRDFHAKLMPTVNKEKIIGVRIPVVPRSFAKEFGKTKEARMFLQVLPHSYYEENNLHGLLLEQIKDYEKCLQELERFLPFIDNWATCDLLAVRTVKKHLDVFIEEGVSLDTITAYIYDTIWNWYVDERYYLDENFQMEYPEKVMQICSKEYYVNMMRAWYFATALAKQYENILPFIEDKKLDVWTQEENNSKSD